MAGVDPALPEHEKYLNQLCEDFTAQIRNMTQSAIREQRDSAVSDPLYEEVAAHTLFCTDKCAKFSGRLDVLSVRSINLLLDMHSSWRISKFHENITVFMSHYFYYNVSSTFFTRIFHVSK